MCETETLPIRAPDELGRLAILLQPLPSVGVFQAPNQKTGPSRSSSSVASRASDLPSELSLMKRPRPDGPGMNSPLQLRQKPLDTTLGYRLIPAAPAQWGISTVTRLLYARFSPIACDGIPGYRLGDN